MRVRLLWVVIVCVCGACSIRAQTVQIEPVLTYEYGYPLTIERSPGIINKFRTSGAGTSFNHTFGLGAALQIPDLFSDQFGIAPRMEYRFGSGQFASEPFVAIQDDTANMPRVTGEHFEVRSSTQSIDFTLPLECSTADFGIGFGPWCNVELSRSIVGTELIDTPATALFSDKSRSRTYASGDTISASHLHAGIEADMYFHIPLSSTLGLEPRLFGRYDLTSAAAIGKKAFSAGVSLSLSPLINPRPESIRVPDTVVTIVRKPSKMLTASVHFTKNGVRTDPDTRVEVVGNSSAYRQYTEIPDFVTFELGSAEIGPSYSQLDKSALKNFRYNVLARAPLPMFGRQLLNLIGYRLATDSSVHITVNTGIKKGTDKLHFARLQAIESYWTRVWDIAPDRILTSKVISGPDHRRSDTIVLQGLEALAPVATQWIERSFHIPHMGIEKSIVADQGLRSWEIYVHQNEKLLSRFTSTDSTTDNPIADFDLSGDSSAVDEHRDPPPLVATLRAEDFAGQRVEVTDTLRLPSREEQAKTVSSREAYVCVILREGMPSGNDSQSSLLIAKLLSVIHPDAHVSISTPPTDPRTVGSTSPGIVERLVSELKRRADLHPDIHIFSRTDANAELPPYEQAIIVRVEQSK
jgi:hypothetical protein